MSTATTRHLAVIGRSSVGLPRTFRVERAPVSPPRDAAYRRLAAAILGLDVSFLADELKTRRLADVSAPRAA
jgi:hypothetical protein